MKDIQDYLIQFVETKQEIFNNFPVCPFAKRERIENKIKFVECSFKNIDTTKIIDETHNWLNGDYSTLLYVDIGDADFYFIKKVKESLVVCIQEGRQDHL